MVASTAVPTAYLAALAGAAAALLALAGATWAGRRAVRRRLTTLALRLTDDPDGVEGARTEALFGLVERGSDRALDAAHTAATAAARLAAALDCVPEAVLVADEAGQVVFRNARASATGAPADAIVEHAMQEVLAGALDDRVRTTPGISRTVEVLGPPPRAYALRAAPVDNGNRTTGAAVVAEDLTEHRAWDRRRRGFFTDAARQLRAPAAAMALLAQMVSEEAAAGDDAMVAQLTARLRREAARAERQAEELADLAAAEREQAPTREAVDLGAVVDEAIGALAARAADLRVTLHWAPVATGTLVVADRRSVVAAVSGLVGTAVELTPAGGAVDVELAAFGGELVLAVSGEAIGGTGAAVSEPFPGPGGLGRSVAAAHGGALGGQRRPDGTGALVLRLPAVGSASCRYGLGAA